jgi:phosphatidylglycerophosphatase A
MTLPRLLCSWFGAGLLPKAPGTWGSLAALPLIWLLAWAGGPKLLGAGMLLLFFVGWWASSRMVEEEGAEDPGWIVIDEVVGQGLTLLLTPPSWLAYAVGFGLFRLFDIKKPWPVSWSDETVKGGLGVMLDDVLAALYGLAAMSLLQRIGLL